MRYNSLLVKCAALMASFAIAASCEIIPEPVPPTPDVPGNTDDTFESYGVDPTKFNINFSASAITFGAAKISVSFKENVPFYAGIYLVQPGASMDGLRALFYEDASPVIDGYMNANEEHVYGDGFYGVPYEADGFNDDISAFATHDNGEGKREPRLVVPTATYAIGILPYKPGTAYKDLSASDVYVRIINLKDLKSTNSDLVKIEDSSSTVTTTYVSLNVASTVNRLYYALVSKKDFESYGLSDMNYVLYHGICWDRTTMKATGPVSGLDDVCSMLEPGEETYVIAAAITRDGNCRLLKESIFSSEVETSDATLSFTGCNQDNVSASYTMLSFKYNCSDDVEKIRYVVAVDQKFDDNDTYATLTAGAMWDYTTVAKGDEITQSVDPSTKAATIYAVGVDKSGKFTTLAKFTYNLK